MAPVSGAPDYNEQFPSELEHTQHHRDLEASLSEGVEASADAPAGGSFQAVAGDVGMNADSGTDDPDTAFVGGVMGHVFDGDDGPPETDGNYTAGVIGAYSVTENPSVRVKAGIAGLIGVNDEVDDDEVIAVAAVVTQPDPGVDHHIRALFGAVGDPLGTPAGTSTVDFGLDLQDTDLTVTVALRLGSNVVVALLAGAPVNGTTLDNIAGKGSLIIDTSNGVLYINTGTLTDSTWVKVGNQS